MLPIVHTLKSFMPFDVKLIQEMKLHYTVWDFQYCPKKSKKKKKSKSVCKSINKRELVKCVYVFAFPHNVLCV